MADNFPGPYQVRILYGSGDLSPGGNISHLASLNLDLTAVPSPGAAFTTINALTKGGVLTPQLDVAMEAWLTLIALMFENITDFGIVELWSFVPDTFNATFISAYTPVANIGTSVQPNLAASQAILTFRTNEGGILRLNFMEAVFPPAASQLYPTLNVGLDAIFDFTASDASWILGRDTSYINAPLRFLPGQNERLFKQRFRNA